MFAKIFEQVYDSSIAEDWQVRVVFQDMLILADKDGIVDRTPEAIARRTNVPLDIVRKAIPILEGPDDTSRSPDLDGRRIVRLDGHRSWGWRIVNFQKYRQSASKEMLRMAEADRKAAYRAKFGNPPKNPPATATDADTEAEAEQSRTCPGQVPDKGVISSKAKQELPEVPAALATPEFTQAWSEWTRHRSEKRQKLTPTCAAKQLAMLGRLGPQKAVAAINHSIEKGWIGLFEQPAQTNGYKQPPTGPQSIAERELLKSDREIQQLKEYLARPIA